jgi:uncharacterized membrane protein YfcA
VPVSIFAWPGAVAIGVSLGLLGSGGSILTVPVLVYLMGQDEKVAIAGSLFIVGSVALTGSMQYLRARLIDWRNVVIFGIPGMAGTYVGALSAAYVSGIVQLSLFAVVMLLASYMMLRPLKLDETSHAPRESWKIAADGLLVGVITGLVGVGGGFLIVPALALLGGFHAQGSGDQSCHHRVEILQWLLQIPGCTGQAKPGAGLAGIDACNRAGNCR